VSHWYFTTIPPWRNETMARPLPKTKSPAPAKYARIFPSVAVDAAPLRPVTKNVRVKSFVEGVTAGAVGAIAGAVIVLARKSLVDPPTIAIAIASLVLLWRVKKLPEPALIAAAGIVGVTVAACGKRDAPPPPASTSAIASVSASAAIASAGAPTWRHDVLPHIETTCAVAHGCHGDDPTDSIDLDLRPAVAYATLVGRPSSVRTSALLVAPGDPKGSFVVDKLTGTLGAKEGKRMPLDADTGAPKPPTPDDDDFRKNKLIPWIAAGAKEE